MSHDETPTRRHPRVPVGVAVRVSTIDPETDPWTGRSFFRASREWCANLSRGGVFIRTTEPFTLGRRLLLELQLPDGRPVEAVGRVAWAKRALERGDASGECGIGVEFLGGASGPAAVLDEFLNRASEPGDAATERK